MAERELSIPQVLALKDLKAPWQKYWKDRNKPNTELGYSVLLVRNCAVNLGCSIYEINRAIFQFTDESERQELLNNSSKNARRYVNSSEDYDKFVHSLLCLEYEFHLQNPFESFDGETPNVTLMN